MDLVISFDGLRTIKINMLELSGRFQKKPLLKGKVKKH